MDVLLAIAVLGFVAWWIRYNQLYRAGAVKLPFFSFGQSTQRPRNVRVSYKPPRATRQSAQVDVGTQKEVGQAVSKITAYTHNYEVSVRLLQSEKGRNPDRSVVWCAEKVIDDIVRDRR